ncbi:MFS transporter [Actinomyces radicidentis]
MPDNNHPDHRPRSTALPRLLTSNGLDAASGTMLDTVLDVVTVTVLGMSTTQLGLLNALGTISFLLLAVPLGSVVDAHGATRVLPVVLTGKVAILAATTALLTTGTLQPAALMVLVTALGVLTAAAENAQVSAVPLIEPDHGRIATAVASLSAADRVAGVVIPGATGLLLAAVGANRMLSVATVLAVLALVAALGLRRSQQRQPEDSEKHVPDDDEADAPATRSSMFSGFHELTSDRLLLASVILTTAGNMGLAIGDSVEAVLVLRRLELGAAYWGGLGTVGAVSGLVAAAVAPRIVRAVEARRIFAVGAMVQAFVAALPLASLLLPGAGAVLMIVFSALWSVTLTVTNIAAGSYLATAVDPAVLGRTAAASRTLTMGSVPVAAFLGGWLGDVVGLAAPLIVWPGLTLAAAIGFVALTGRRPA